MKRQLAALHTTEVTRQQCSVFPGGLPLDDFTLTAPCGCVNVGMSGVSALPLRWRRGWDREKNHNNVITILTNKARPTTNITVHTYTHTRAHTHRGPTAVTVVEAMVMMMAANIYSIIVKRAFLHAHRPLSSCSLSSSSSLLSYNKNHNTNNYDNENDDNNSSNSNTTTTAAKCDDDFYHDHYYDYGYYHCYHDDDDDYNYYFDRCMLSRGLGVYYVCDRFSLPQFKFN